MKNILLLILIFFSYSSVLNAQTFDQQKHDALKEKLSGNKIKISRRGRLQTNKVNDLLYGEEDKDDEALNYINNLDPNKLNGSEKLIFDQYLATISVRKNNYVEAIEAYVRARENPTIKFSAYKQFTFVLGQLYFSIDEHEKSLEYINEFLSINQSPSWPVFKVIITNHLQLKNYNEALKYTEMAEQSINFTFENYDEKQKKRFQKTTDEYRGQISATKQMLIKALNGEDIVPEIPTVKKAKKSNKVAFDGPYQFLHFQNPEYPPKAAKEKLEGYVLMQFDIDTNGKAINTKVLESSNKVFEKSALKSVSGHLFKILKGANENGQLIGVRLRSEFKYKS